MKRPIKREMPSETAAADNPPSDDLLMAIEIVSASSERIEVSLDFFAKLEKAKARMDRAAQRDQKKKETGS